MSRYVFMWSRFLGGFTCFHGIVSARNLERSSITEFRIKDYGTSLLIHLSPSCKLARSVWYSGSGRSLDQGRALSDGFHHWAGTCSSSAGTKSWDLLASLGIRLTETDRFGSSVLWEIRLAENSEPIG
jgi:hypothetical protein